MSRLMSVEGVCQERRSKVRKFYNSLCRDGEFLSKTEFSRQFQVYYFKRRKREIKVLREIGTSKLFIRLDHSLAVAMGYQSLIDMMCRDEILDTLNDAKLRYGYWVAK